MLAALVLRETLFFGLTCEKASTELCGSRAHPLPVTARQESSFPLLSREHGREGGNLMLRMGQQHLLGDPLVLGPFPGSTDPSVLCWDVRIAAATSESARQELVGVRNANGSET